MVIETRFGPRADSLVVRLAQLDLDALDKLSKQLDAGSDLDQLT